MKRFLIILPLLLLSLLLVKGSSNAYYLAEASTDSQILPIDSSEIATPSSAKSEVNYELPYPGILPGSPLYPLKVLRDRMVELLISDPIKKGEFYILEGDKHINSAILIINNSKNYSLAEDTVSKGENYMQRVFSQADQAKQIQQDPTELLKHLSISLRKHEEEIKKMEKNAPSDVVQKLEIAYQRTLEYQKMVDNFLSIQQSKSPK